MAEGPSGARDPQVDAPLAWPRAALSLCFVLAATAAVVEARGECVGCGPARGATRFGLVGAVLYGLLLAVSFARLPSWSFPMFLCGASGVHAALVGQQLRQAVTCPWCMAVAVAVLLAAGVWIRVSTLPLRTGMLTAGVALLGAHLAISSLRPAPWQTRLLGALPDAAFRQEVVSVLWLSKDGDEDPVQSREAWRSIHEEFGPTVRCGTGRLPPDGDLPSRIIVVGRSRADAAVLVASAGYADLRAGILARRTH